MFLDALLRRNPRFVETAIALHQSGSIPANSYVLDLDTIESNTEGLCRVADDLGLTVYAMTKQIGRAAAALDAITAGGADGFVAVDMACARPIVRAEHSVGHLGHLVQVPQSESAEAAALEPDFWTVFSRRKAERAAAAAHASGRSQPLLVRVFDDGDEFYPGHEGGIALSELRAAIDHIATLDGAIFSGLTTFPALLYDAASRSAQLTPNMGTLARAAEIARKHRACPERLQINAPGTTSTQVLPMLAEAGATQVEPGHGLSGTTPLHAVEDLPELPAVLYLSEIAHIHHGVPLCFGGGLYIDPVFGDYQVRALVADDSSDIDTQPVPVEMPSPAAIDYYARLTPPAQHTFQEGSTVVFGFRIQAFVTRAFIVGVSGVARGEPRVAGIWNGFGDPVTLGVQT
ncbi:alanine racemase [Candidatus Poriferisodalis sp.]|uniref:alanine racemase n=1 Tax=Candidatus Poriferisodalis sp. TaxID=3101277 RepID=UPI003B023C8E